MKRMFKIGALVLVITICFTLNLPIAQAHEIFPSYPLRWVIKSPVGLYYHTKVNGDLLASDSIYRNNIDGAVSAWMSSPTLAYCTREDFSVSNVDLTTGSEAFWSQYNLGSGVLAITFLTDTSGTQILTESDAQYSSRQIKYSGIFFNPYHTQGFSWIFDGIDDHDDQQMGVIVHEIGHVYCLGHCPQSTYSIMRPTMTSSNPFSLVQHDIDDMNAFY